MNEYDRGYYDALNWVYEHTYGDNYKLSVKDKIQKFIKELSIEEKARAYDEAIERAKNFIENGDERERTIAESIFAGIMEESEDERIRKDLIAFLDDVWHLGKNANFDKWGKANCSDWIAWLEKQGNPKLTSKFKPKFKVGDWIICQYMHLVMQILNNDNGSYKTVEIDGTERNDSYDFIERNCKLWTIKDAKDGDVLKEDSCIFIIKKMNPNGTAIVHCCLFDDGELDSTGSTLGFDVDSTHPATKEQCDLLFSEMKEVGYEWDAEKKELKDISKKI
jgi:hypothetical protein